MNLKKSLLTPNLIDWKMKGKDYLKTQSKELSKCTGTEKKKILEG